MRLLRIRMTTFTGRLIYQTAILECEPAQALLKESRKSGRLKITAAS